MKSATETKNLKKIEEYRNDVTIHLVRICGDLVHIKEKVESNNKHLEKINGRLRSAENNITAIKTIGTTLTFVIGCILTWFGVQK
jgi:predicted  nucleic acid-binding Zn-ribbon protein